MRARGEMYGSYIYKILKQVHPGCGATKKTMVIMENLVADIFERIAREAAKLARKNGKMTIGAREIQTAVRLIFPGSLGKHATVEGTKALSKYIS